jgi:hypothetical protein
MIVNDEDGRVLKQVWDYFATLPVFIWKEENHETLRRV